MPKIEQAISAGLDYLAGQQQSDGGFNSFSSPSARPFRPEKTYQTTFAPALILSSLSSSDVPAALSMRGRLAIWLGEQASLRWSFNYWSARSPERRRQPYPDDLDDTFCALSALYTHEPALVDGKVLAAAVKLLLAAESTVGGPYRTWLAPARASSSWRDVDLAVNANVAYFLSLAAEPLPNLTNFIDQSISESELASPYYPSAFPVIYYIARGYSGKHRATLLKMLRAMVKTTASALDLALCLSSMNRLGIRAKPTDIDRLLAAQLPDGSWPAAAFCLDPAASGRAYYSGSAALTTAFAIEALELRRTRRPVSPSQSVHRGIPNRHQEKVVQLIQEQCAPLPAELRDATVRSIQALADGGNGNEIIGLAAHFNESLKTPLDSTAAPLLLKLGAANLYGWTAYTIYDDFLDGEGRSELLSTANVAMRYSLTNWREALPGNETFAELVARTFDTIDGANAWELANCRFTVTGKRIMIGALPGYGDLSKLAERSMGHGLGPLAVLIRAGTSIESRSVRQLQQAFKYYLIARQLNDDCHDWADDLRSGHITYVVSRLLSGLHVEPGSRVLATLHKRARAQFWHTTLPLLCEEILAHLRSSRSALRTIKEIKPSNVLTGLLDELEAVTTKTIAERERSLEFLKQYGAAKTAPSGGE